MSTVIEANAQVKLNLISTSEAAKIIGCAESHVRRLLLDGVLSGQKLNKRAWAVRRDSADDYAQNPSKIGRPRGS